MAKALIFSDLHIHAHKDRVDRLQHCLDVLNWIFEEANRQECDYIFFLGDLFHEREKIDVLNYMKTFECFMHHMMNDNSSREMYLLVGNHDMYHKERWDVNSVKPLTAIPRVHIVDKPTSIKFGKTQIDWMPHTDNPIKELEKLKKNNSVGDILFGHMSVHGAQLNICFGTKSDVIVEYDNEMIPVDPSIFDDWKMTFLGHYHGAQQLNEKAEYVGSPLELTFGEAFQEKHVIVLDLDTLSKKYIVNNFTPKHLIVTPKDIKNEVYDLSGNFVRLTLENVTQKELVDLKKTINENYKILSFDTKKKERKTEEDEIIIENAKALMLNINEMLKNYVKERGVPDGLNENKLIKAGEKCLEKTT